MSYFLKHQFYHLLFIFSFFCLFVVGCTSQNYSDNSLILTSINLIDRNGFSETISNQDRLKQYENIDFLRPQPYQKVLRVYNRDQRGDIHAFVTSYHPNGQAKQYLEVVNNRAFGLYREWFSNGNLKLETNVIGGTADLNTAAERSWLFDGCSKAWDECGNLIAEIPYSKGELQGFSVYYHPNGNVWKRVPFNHNQIEGTSEIYLESGELLQTTSYRQGIKDGPSLRYWIDGSLSSEENYCNGMLMQGSYFDSCGQLAAQINEGTGFRAVFSKEAICELQEYHYGVLEGEVKVYDKNSNPMKIYHIKKGLKHGEEIEFQRIRTMAGEHIVPLLSINWYEGKIQGIVKTWYDDGGLQSQREMSNNAKNGLSTAWYKDGSLMMIEEYEKDRLNKGEYYKRGEKIPISQVEAGKGIATLFDSEGHFLRKINYFNGRPQE